jgi:hypothetical protein
MLAFLDIEASGLSDHSYPIEIGWAIPFGEEHSAKAKAPMSLLWQSASVYGCAQTGNHNDYSTVG